MNKLASIKKHQKTILLCSLVVLIEFLFFTSISYPPTLLYPVKHNLQNLTATLTPSHKAKAKIYLDEADRLQKHLITLSPTDKSLAPVFQELINQEKIAIQHMDQAKKGGADIKNQVEILCDTLIKQYTQLQQAIAQDSANPILQQAINTTKVNLDESSGW